MSIKRFQRLWIPGPMPSLNDIIEDNRRVFRARRKDGKPVLKTVYSKTKTAWQDAIATQAQAQGFQKIMEPSSYTFILYERNRRRDPDNITAGAKKLIFDSLRHAGFLKNDGWADVLGINAFWAVHQTQPGVVLYVAPGCLTKEAAFLMEKHQNERRERKKGS